MEDEQWSRSEPTLTLKAIGQSYPVKPNNII